MAEPVPFRRYKPPVVETQFFIPTSTINQEFANEDLARSGLVLNDIEGAAPPNLRKPTSASAAYCIPYFDLNGAPLVDGNQNCTFYRLRLKYPDFHRGSRYTQPSSEECHARGLPGYLPYVPPQPGAKHVYCCEGEKKTLALRKFLGVAAFGIGGCQVWRHPADPGALHPWIAELISKWGVERLTIIPDGDVLRYDICAAYGGFARAVEALGVQVDILQPDGKIDDLLVGGLRTLEGMSTLRVEDLVQSPSALVTKHNLAFKRDKNDRVIIHQHSSNVMKILECEKYFPRVWRNTDTNKVMLGDVAAVPDLTEMEIANYLQHNLGFEKVTSRLVQQCVAALARRHARSPFLEWVQAQRWDGVGRLDTWLSRLWGVEQSEHTALAGARWLLSSCARMAQPGAVVQWMLIVVGPQHVGKTSMPEVIFNGHALTLYGEQNDKDLHMLLHSALCVGFDELDSFGKRESSNLKAMITRREDAFRPPYGASVESYPRRFVLYGCGNRHEFLQHDPSGYRRYVVVEVNRMLDFEGLKAEVGQLWAEAWARYQAGEAYGSVDTANLEAKKFVVPSLIEEAVKNYLNMVGGRKFTLGELANYMSVSTKDSYMVREIAAVLRGLGYAEKGGFYVVG